MHRLALAAVALAAAACASGGGDAKPSPSASPSRTVAATLRVSVADTSGGNLTRAVAHILSARLTTLGEPPVSTTLNAGTVTFGLPRAPTTAEVAALRARGRLTFRPVLSTTAPNGCATVRAAADGAQVVACDTEETTTYVLGPAELTGADVKSATAQAAGEHWIVALSMKSAARWADVTEKYVNKQLAIVLDGVVQSAPNVNEKIPDGNATISGSFHEEEARVLAAILTSGVLPADVTIS